MIKGWAIFIDDKLIQEGTFQECAIFLSEGAAKKVWVEGGFDTKKEYRIEEVEVIVVRTSITI